MPAQIYSWDICPDDDDTPRAHVVFSFTDHEPHRDITSTFTLRQLLVLEAKISKIRQQLSFDCADAIEARKLP